MNVVEKRDFIHSHLHQVDESVIDQLYKMLRKDEVLKTKLVSRAEKSENDIQEGKVFTRRDVEQRSQELKFELFQKIENLSDSDLEGIYKTVLSLLTPSEEYILSPAEEKAIEEALECSRKGEVFTHESVMKEAQLRYPQFKFK